MTFIRLKNRFFPVAPLMVLDSGLQHAGMTFNTPDAGMTCNTPDAGMTCNTPDAGMTCNTPGPSFPHVVS
ncbi:MAG: hypothetical protein RQ753_10665, partial [Desulfurivibrionaceae bacterium]|nr:hypothetical protein [Desulfurivibrionaceae bacterium]